MTLQRQLFLGLTLLFIVLLTASMTISLYNARRHLHEQMTIHARDTARSLSLSIADAAAANDNSRIASIIRNNRDSSYNHTIIYRNTAGERPVEQLPATEPADIPHWFIRLVPVHVPTGKAEVMSGWSQIGSIEVTPHPGFAYRDLWNTFREQLLLFGIVGALAYLCSAFAFSLLLRPLRKVEEQAAAICERHFVEQAELPRTRELRQVVTAINRMSRKLKDIFQEQLALTESLRAQSHLDPVTGLSNRREFNARLQAVADSETGNGGCLMIMQVSHFGRYNLQHGHEAGDECLRAIAAQLLGVTTGSPDAIISRRAGADFAIYLPRIDVDRARAIADQLITQLAKLDILFTHPIHIGLSCCDILRADHRMLSEADLALRQAQSRGHSGWQLYQGGEISQIAREARQWYATLNRILIDRSITFHYQPIFLRDSEQAMASEVFCRITVQDKLVHAGIFLPMAERFSLAEAFDRLIIDEVRLRNTTTDPAVPLCINLSPQTISSPDFLEWLDSYLAMHSSFARKLVIETSEYLVRTGADKVRTLCDMLHRRGTRLSLDHFGIHSAAFGYLNSLPIDYVKIDRSFIRDIHLDTDNQFYVQSLTQIAHSCDITILAEGIENLQEWQCLQGLGVNGGQGYFLCRPDSTIVTARK